MVGMDDPSQEPIAVPKSRRRWFQFSLRTTLTAIALICVWLGVITYRADTQRRAVEAIKAANGIVGYDYERDDDGNFDRSRASSPPGPSWLRRLIGVDYFANVVDVAFLFDQRSVEPLTQLAEPLGRLPHLRALSFGGNFNDLDLAHVENFTQLTDLSLAWTEVTDAGLIHLESMTHLRKLSLFQCRHVTDSGLQRLSGLADLQLLQVGGTSVTYAGVSALKESLPKIQIYGVHIDRTTGKIKVD
jgi:hypothetical protein